MRAKNFQNHANAVIMAVTALVPEYILSQYKPASELSAAICIIDEAGNISGKLFGNEKCDKLRMREKYHTAWVKANQVWITGMNTFNLFAYAIIVATLTD